VPRKRKKLSSVFLIADVAVVVASLGLCGLVIPRMNSDLALPYALVGYLLTPIVAWSILVLARQSDLRLQADSQYLRAQGQRQVRLIGVIAIIGLIPAAVHIWYLSGFVGSVLS
jgi:hypothetical protein